MFSYYKKLFLSPILTYATTPDMPYVPDDNKSVKDKGISELLKDISHDGKLDAQDLERIEELQLKINNEKESITSESQQQLDNLKTELTKNLESMFQSGFTVESEADYNVLLVSAKLAYEKVNLPKYENIQDIFGKNKTLSFVYGEPQRLCVFEKDLGMYRKGDGNNTDERGSIDLVDGKINTGFFAEIEASFENGGDDDLSDNNRFSYSSDIDLKKEVVVEDKVEEMVEAEDIQEETMSTEIQPTQEEINEMNEKFEISLSLLSELRELVNKIRSDRADLDPKMNQDMVKFMNEYFGGIVSASDRLVGENFDSYKKKIELVSIIDDFEEKEFIKKLREIADVLVSVNQPEKKETDTPVVSVTKKSETSDSTDELEELPKLTKKTEVAERLYGNESERKTAVTKAISRYRLSEDKYSSLKELFNTTIVVSRKSTWDEINHFIERMNTIDNGGETLGREITRSEGMKQDKKESEDGSIIDGVKDSASEGYDIVSEEVKSFGQWILELFDQDPELAKIILDNGDTLEIEFDNETGNIVIDTPWFDGVKDYIHVVEKEFTSADEAKSYLTENVLSKIKDNYNQKLKSEKQAPEVIDEPFKGLLDLDALDSYKAALSSDNSIYTIGEYIKADGSLEEVKVKHKVDGKMYIELDDSVPGMFSKDITREISSDITNSADLQKAMDEILLAYKDKESHE